MATEPLRCACKLTDADMVRGCAPPQPDEIAVGQEWMDAETGTVLPVKAIRGEYIDLGGLSYTRIVTAEQLRAGYVCVDPTDNVVRLSVGAAGDQEHT